MKISQENLNNLQNFSLKAASLTCHGVGFAAEAATEVAKTAKVIGGLATSLLVARMITGLVDVVVNDSALPDWDISKELCIAFANDSGEVTDPCGEITFDCGVFIYAAAITGAVHLTAKGSSLLAQHAHDLGNHFGQLSSRKIAELK